MHGHIAVKCTYIHTVTCIVLSCWCPVDDQFAVYSGMYRVAGSSLIAGVCGQSPQRGPGGDWANLPLKVKSVSGIICCIDGYACEVRVCDVCTKLNRLRCTPPPHLRIGLTAEFAVLTYMRAKCVFVMSVVNWTDFRVTVTLTLMSLLHCSITR